MTRADRYFRLEQQRRRCMALRERQIAQHRSTEHTDRLLQGIVQEMLKLEIRMMGAAA